MPPPTSTTVATWAPDRISTCSPDGLTLMTERYLDLSRTAFGLRPTSAMAAKTGGAGLPVGSYTAA